MIKKIRTGVVGVGGMGINHCRILSKISTLVGVCDKDEAKAKRASQQFGVPYFLTPSELIDKCKTQAITVAVNTEYHKKVALEIINKEIPLLVEKPLAQNSKQALDIVRRAKMNNVFLMVGMVERYNPTVIKLKSDIEKKVFGDIYQMVALRVGISAPNMNPRSVDVDLAVHDVDIVNFLLGEKPKKAVKRGNRYLKNSIFDTCSLTLSYKNTTATAISNWMSPVKIRKLFIFGEKMSAEVNLLNQAIYYFSKIPINAIKKSNYYSSFQELGAYSRQIIFKKSEPLSEELGMFLKNINSGYKREYCENGLIALRSIDAAL